MLKKNTANTEYDQSCSTSDPERSWSVKINQIENVTVKKTLAGFSLSLGFVCKCFSAKNVGKLVVFGSWERFCRSRDYTFHSTGRTPTTSNLISLVKLLMLSIWFNVACVIYNILEKLNVASKTVLMNVDDLYSTLLVITSIMQFQNTFWPVIIPTIICFWFLLKNLKMGVILSGKHVKPTLSIKLRQLNLWASINVMNCNYI